MKMKCLSWLITLAAVMICLAVLPTKAQAASVDDLTFELSDDGNSYLVTDCKESASGVLEIPATYNGKPVTGIGTWEKSEGVFQYCTGLTSITIPDSVTSIAWFAFRNCTGLTSVTIGDGVTSIGESAFYNCTSLTSITIPDGVTSIGYFAFKNCTSLTSITIPDSVTSIEDRAFEDCTSLRYAEYGNSLYLGNGNNPYLALVKTKSEDITECEIHNNTSLIADSAFEDCTRLTSITIPAGVTSVGDFALYGCTGLTTVNFNATNCTNMGLGYDYVFSGCTNLATVNIGKDVTNIPAYAFVNCTGLTNITIPDSVTSIGARAFEGCISLNSVAVGNGVISIEGFAFSGCAGLTSVNIPNSVTAIGEQAFYNCMNLSVTYCGSEEQWNAVRIADGNTALIRVLPQFHNYANGVCTVCRASEPTATPPTQTPTGSQGSTNTSTGNQQPTNTPGEPATTPTEQVTTPTEPTNNEKDNGGNNTVWMLVIGIAIGCVVGSAVTFILMKKKK